MMLEEQNKNEIKIVLKEKERIKEKKEERKIGRKKFEGRIGEKWK